MKNVVKLAAAALLSAVGLAVTASSASAYIVCNREGECWHVHSRYAYHPEFGLAVHPDGWAWGANEHYVWREHRGRGYWHNGIWVRF
jgi:hypothetical protein